MVFGLFSKKGKKEKNKEEYKSKSMAQRAKEAEDKTMADIDSMFEGYEGDKHEEVDDEVISREEMLEAVKKDGYDLKDADDSFKADREVVLEAVKSYGLALDYADDTLKADREVVLEAVKQDGYALDYADDTLKADREVVLAAIRCEGRGQAIRCAAETLRADREIVLEAMKNGGGNALNYVSEELQNDPEVKKIAEG